MERFFREVICVAASDSLIAAFVNTMLFGSVLILILLAARPFLKKLPRIGMYLLWLALGFRLLLPVNMFQFFPDDIYARVLEAADSIGIGSMKDHDQAEEPDQPAAGVIHTEERTAAKLFLKTIKIFWALGVLFLLIYMLGSVLRIRLRLRDARKVGECVYTHPLISNSFATGGNNPRIYLSERVEGDDKRYILCHESVHIYRHDPFIKHMMFLICAVFWINPLMWAACHYMTEDMEISCDEAVIRRFGEHRRKHYSELLLRMSAVADTYQRPFVSFCTGGASERIRHILDYHERGKIFWLLYLIFICCGIGIILSVPIPGTGV